jgi:hypothetical protein
VKSRECRALRESGVGGGWRGSRRWKREKKEGGRERERKSGVELLNNENAVCKGLV